VRAAKISAEQRKGMPFAVTDQDAADSIENIPGALGTGTLALILSEKREIKALSWNGMVPDPASLADGSYPFYKVYSVVTGPKTPPLAKDFAVFIQSATAREILVANGHWVR